jgi:DNA (cytosine-5)-methyltransferase 1
VGPERRGYILRTHVGDAVNVLDLFSGIGGFSLGLERAGMRTVAFCECDPYAVRVLNRAWPGVPVYPDVRTIPHIGGIDIVAGGFPCQPWSQAGKRMGAEDDRHLWPAMLEVIKRERPAWVLGENVAGLINMGLDAVLSDLEAIGYAWRTFVIPAVAVDAPHRRDRLWIVAHDDNRGSLLGSSDGEPKEGMDEQRRDDAAGLCADVPDPLRPRGAAGLSGPQSRQEGHTGEPDHRGGQSGWREEGCVWEPEPEVGRLADGVPDRAHQLRCLGNAVVPQIPEIIGRAIMAADEASDTP